MASKDSHRSAEFEDLVRWAREQHLASNGKPVAFVPEPLPPAAAAWAEELITSGELRRAIDRIAAEDPELAS